MNAVNAAGGGDAPAPWLRTAVRELLLSSPGYDALAPEQKRALAQSMVRVSTLAADLIAEEQDANAAAARNGSTRAAARGGGAPLARAQGQPDFGEAASRVAGITRNVLGAVSFPRFVTDLINGVFKSMLDSTSQQMKMYVELLNNVSASAEGFEKTQFSLGSTRQWLAEQFPGELVYEPPEVDPDFPPDPDEEPEEVQLRLREGARMPEEEALRTSLGMQPGETLNASNPEQLVPLARRQIARQRQQMLATMVMLGMQRIVIDSGRINASMRFHIDTRSAAQQDQGSRTGFENKVRAAGSYGVGPWGVSADVQNTISFVSTQQSQHTEEINTDLDLNSSVEINFHTDYLPLNQMSAPSQADRIRGASLNPDAANDQVSERQARYSAQSTADKERANRIDASLRAPVGAADTSPMPTPPPLSERTDSEGRPLVAPGTNAPAARNSGDGMPRPPPLSERTDSQGQPLVAPGTNTTASGNNGNTANTASNSTTAATTH